MSVDNESDDTDTIEMSRFDAVFKNYSINEIGNYSDLDFFNQRKF